MSVIIRCMDMPECCMDCPFLKREEMLVSGKDGLWKHIYNCLWCPEEEEDGWQDVNWVQHNRQEWCPLEEGR